MKILVVGGGAREHVIAETAAKFGGEIYVALANRNPGLLRLARETLTTKDTAVERIAKWAAERGIELAIIGPESALAAGIVDALNDKGIPAAGPTRAAARLETDKEFMRGLLDRYRVPGQLAYRVCDSPGAVRAFLTEFGRDCAIKPIGLTGGKGVAVMGDQFHGIDAAVEYARKCIDSGLGGASKVVVEERAVGQEFTLQAFVAGATLRPMPTAQDHPHADEGDVGAITGGMGSYSQGDGLLPFMSRDDYDAALAGMEGAVQAMASEGAPYHGFLYGQFVLTADGPRIVEFNARFGDPEAMNVLPLLQTDFLSVCHGIADGRLGEVEFARQASVCKYVVPEGYGTAPRADCTLVVDDDALAASGARAYYAAVNLADDGTITTTTSRSAGVVGFGDDLAAAEAQCEAGLEAVSGRGLFVRHDIATPASLAKRVRHMAALRG